MKFASTFMLGAALAVMPLAAEASSAEGTWLSQDGGTKVKLSDCGGKLCGNIVWLKRPIDRTTGKPQTDKHNPDPAARERPLLGLQVVSNLSPNGPNTWSGKIYNADDGNTYSGNMKVQSSRTARVEGCVLAVLCKGQIWTRAD
jgi:uncharacterized protein (DUF2147 family)